MSAEKHQHLIDVGLLNPDGSRPGPHVVTAEEAGVSEEEAAGTGGDATGQTESIDAIAYAEPVEAGVVDPSQEA